MYSLLMWLYLGFGAVALLGWYFNKIPTPREVVTAAKHTRTVSAALYNIIRKNGLGVCLIWTKQVIANQIGKNLVEMHHTHYIIHYPYGVTWYKIIIPRRRGPCLIDTITDQDGNDVKHAVSAYLGPSHNFHGLTVTPEMLGYSTLTFAYISGKTEIFERNSPIIL